MPRLPAMRAAKRSGGKAPAKASVAPSTGVKASRYGRGGYEGARTDKRELMAWRPGANSPDSDTLADLPELRGRSRDSERNDALAGGAILTQLDNVAGSGLTATPQIDREYLQLTDEAADAWEDAAERIVAAVTDTKAFDIAGRATFGEQQRMVLGGVLGSGDIFAIRRNVARPGDLLSLKIQLVEADRVSNPTGRMDSSILRDGIEFDANGLAIACHVASQFPSEFAYDQPITTYERLPFTGPTSGRPLVLHCIEQTRPGLSRGVPYLAPVLKLLKQLSRYSESELAAAVIQSFYTVFLKKREMLEGEGSGLQDLSDPDTDGLIVPENTVKLGQGAVVELPDGLEPVFADPSRPNDKFDPFFLAITRLIGVRLGIPFELLIKHFSSSYSASRAALLEAWRSFEARQEWLVKSFCQPVYEWVITEAVARGFLVAPGFFTDPLIRRAYLGAAWNGPTVSQLDPLKEVTAAKMRIDELLSTRDYEARQLTGLAFRRIVAQRKKEARLVKDAGLIEPSAAAVAVNAHVTTDPSSDPNAPTNKGTNDQEQARAA